MHRYLVFFVAFSMLLACSKSSEPRENEPTETPEATPVATDNTVAPSPIPSPPKAPPKDVYPKKPEPNVHGEVEHLARLGGNSEPLHNVAVLGQYAYVDDAAGTIHRVKITGGELQVVHDSDDGAGVHGSRPVRVGDSIYFTIDGQEDDTTILSKVVDGKAVPVTTAPRATAACTLWPRLVEPRNCSSMDSTITTSLLRMRAECIFGPGALPVRSFASTPRPTKSRRSSMASMLRGASQFRMAGSTWSAGATYFV